MSADGAREGIGPAGTQPIATAPAAVTTPPRTVPADHPAFAGHFPGQPLLPGVLLLAEAMEALAAAPALAAALGPAPTLAAAKFLAPVRPGDALVVVLTPAAGGAVAFEVRCGGRTAASGRFVPSAPAAGRTAP